MATSHKVILAETLSPTFVGLTFQVIFVNDDHHNQHDQYGWNLLSELIIIISMINIIMIIIFSILMIILNQAGGWNLLSDLIIIFNMINMIMIIIISINMITINNPGGGWNLLSEAQPGAGCNGSEIFPNHQIVCHHIHLVINHNQDLIIIIITSTWC